MKKYLGWAVMLAIVFVCVIGCAFAEDTEVSEAESVLTEGYEDSDILSMSETDTQAAAVIYDGENVILCVAERTHEGWTRYVENAHVFPDVDADEYTVEYLDGDSLYWTCAWNENLNVYTVAAIPDVGLCIFYWRPAEGTNLLETLIYDQDGAVCREDNILDENDNILSNEVYTPVEMEGVEELFSLEGFDAGNEAIAVWKEDGLSE